MPPIIATIAVGESLPFPTEPVGPSAGGAERGVGGGGEEAGIGGGGVEAAIGGGELAVSRRAKNY